MAECPICKVAIPEPMPPFCEQCGWNFEHDITLVPSLHEIPADSDIIKNYKARVQIARKRWNERVEIIDKRPSEDKNIKIKKERGVIFVIDSGVSYDLYEMVKNNVRIDCPFKLGALSLSKEIKENDIGNLQQMLKNRGRFITPLIEDFFQGIPDKEYDLVILHSGKIYDLDDYKTELESKFGTLMIIDSNRMTFQGL